MLLRAASRRTEATACLRELRAGEASNATVPGVKCAAAKVKPLRDKNNQATVTALLGLATALLGGIGAGRTLRFQNTP